MPLNRKIVWAALMRGSGGTTQLVEKDEIGWPALLVQPVKATHPSTCAKGSTPGMLRWSCCPRSSSAGSDRLRGISGSGPDLRLITPRSCTSCPPSCSNLMFRFSIRSR